jgi:hypothetical protein
MKYVKTNRPIDGLASTIEVDKFKQYDQLLNLGSIHVNPRLNGEGADEPYPVMHDQHVMDFQNPRYAPLTREPGRLDGVKNYLRGLWATLLSMIP